MTSSRNYRQGRRKREHQDLLETPIALAEKRPRGASASVWNQKRRRRRSVPLTEFVGPVKIGTPGASRVSGVLDVSSFLVDLEYDWGWLVGGNLVSTIKQPVSTTILLIYASRNLLVEIESKDARSRKTPGVGQHRHAEERQRVDS